MTVFVIVMIVLAAASGLIVKFAAPQLNRAGLVRSELNIDWSEFAVTVLVMGVVFTPLLYVIGDHYSRAEQLQYEEFYNGVETGAIQNVRECYPGHAGDDEAAGRSNCTYTFVCGTYDYQESYPDTETYIDGDGKVQTRTVTKWRTVSASIECPYLTHEYTYTITDSLPDGTHNLPGVYGAVDANPWDQGVGIPANIPLGPPKEWVTSRDRLGNGDPRPVTRMYKYNNFILAAKEDLLLPYVKDIKSYRDKGLLPDHTKNIKDDPLYGYNGSIADKLSFVGVKPPGGNARWQEALNGLNGALGMTLQGDVHMVIVDSNKVTSPVTYTQALKAYWTGEDFGRRAVAKNSIIIAVGVDGDKVKWGEALTGMPYGNEVMLEAISTRLNSGDVPFTPEAIIGNPRLAFKAKDGEQEPKTILAEKPGVIEGVILDDFPFKRASMECKDKEDGKNCLGFGHLVSKLRPSTGTMITIGFIAVSIMFFLWCMAAIFEWFAVLPYYVKEFLSKR